MGLTVGDFAAFHRAVHGQTPFDWQIRLLARLVQTGSWPRVLDLPTASGKTTCIDIALFALALDAVQHPPAERRCPRRIAMVVDRRVVVDQVAERGRKLRRAFTEPGASSVIREVADALRSVGTGEEPLDVYTLRGGMPRDDGWARTPDRPLVIASTVDQLGSRLLIQGYGVSSGMRPVHAGLLGNDTLLLLDEVHLSHPFAETLDQLQLLRQPFGRTSGVPSRFQHAFLSATPGGVETDAFRLTEEETRPGSALGPRLHASKPVRLREVAGRGALEEACEAEARALIGKHRVVAVIVNRVASAAAIAQRLRDLTPDVEIALLTGRMRPIDRDDALRALRPRVSVGRDRRSTTSPLIVVGTQSLEAGADFDFDALVTEAASLDALRQRFGRVDRLGEYGKAQGVIARDRSVKDDPVYGGAISTTFDWLEGRRDPTSKTIDFGILALPLPEGDQLEAMLPPKQHAPIMLPAYLDLWMQTSPPPAVVPEPALWLHGPESAPADIQVVWRADLTEDDLQDAIQEGALGEARARPAAIVASIPPSSLEAMPLPFSAALAWLTGGSPHDIVDVEGGLAGDDARPPRASQPVLVWDARESRVVLPARDTVHPGATVVVPAERGGIRDRCFDPRATGRVRDLAEQAVFFARGRPVLRLNPSVLEGLELQLPTDELEDARTGLREAAQERTGTWQGLWLDAVRRGRAFLVDGKQSWMVLEARPLPAARIRQFLSVGDSQEAGAPATTDADESPFSGRRVALADHSANVERRARALGGAVGLPASLVDDLALAAWLHDIGKADPRFQLTLREGDEIELLKDDTILAKSGSPIGALTAHRRAAAASRYPAGARHEVQSVALLGQQLNQVRERAHDLDLVLHLVATHHGYCRPFAPAVADPAPVPIQLVGHESAVFGCLDFATTTSAHELHRLDSPLAERFWRMVERYGWLELCWLEAILRLADHRASESEQEAREEK